IGEGRGHAGLHRRRRPAQGVQGGGQGDAPPFEKGEMIRPLAPRLPGLCSFSFREKPMRKFVAVVAFVSLAVPVLRADEKDDAAKKLEGPYDVVAVLVAGKA